ncbi:MAG: DUF1464 family protein [Longimicrobiales bacterium]
MPRVLGIDPGTLSIDVCGLDQGRVFLDESVPTTRADAGDALIALIERAGAVNLVLGPSGYGLPLVPIEEVRERDLALAFLPSQSGSAGIGGLRALIRRLRDAGLPVVFAPGVIHLPTVPSHRKINRIDVGTADKVCAAALAIHDQAERLGVAPDATALILVELGGAFTAVLAIERGQIIDGVGGSSGPLGYRAGGAVDGEVACLLGGFEKGVVFSGGVADIAGRPELLPEVFAERMDDEAIRARTAFIEGIVKAVAAELTLLGRTADILVSGRLSRIPGFYEPVASALARLAPVRRVASIARHAKEAAQGAALLADGLAGGEHAPLVHALRLRDAAGTVLDHLYVKGAAEARERLLSNRLEGP